jgi:hypothetical protein
MLALGASCADQDEGEKAQPLAKGLAEAPIAIDASPAPSEPLQAAPLTGTHIDGDGIGYRPAGQPLRAQPQTRNKGNAIELVLRSTPPGAIASIDGKPIGNTPTFWRGAADGKPHEYTFTKRGYSMARYRFVSTQSGVVHGSLKALVEGVEKADPAAQ